MIEELSISAQKEHGMVHIVIICDSSIKIVIHTGSMRSAIMVVVERSGRWCFNFDVFSEAFEVFQHWTSDRRPNYTENTWDSVLTTPEIKDASDSRDGKLLRRGTIPGTYVYMLPIHPSRHSSSDIHKQVKSGTPLVHNLDKALSHR